MKATHLLFIFLLGVSSSFGQTVADFAGYPLRSCNPPYEVTFENYSQGDTAWHWDFGDGNTSFFPNPIHLYAAADTYTVMLIAYGPSGYDTLVREDYILAIPPPPVPTLNKMADTVNCGAGVEFIASTPDEAVWFDINNNEVYRGDTLDLPYLTNSASFFVRSEDTGLPQQLGPSSHTEIGGGGFFNGSQGLVFNVYSDIILRSVLVNSGAAGTRTIELQDTFGVILQTLNVNIPAGISRIPLNLELLPGNYRLMGDNMNLYRNNSGITNYPYSAPGLVDIVSSTAGNNFYYFFYDWEVSTFCRSASERVDVLVNGIAPPVISQDTVTVGCGAAGQLIASATDEVNWYDGFGTLVHVGDTLDVPFVGGTATYTARNVAENATVKLGPPHPDSVGTGGIYPFAFPAYLEFDVLSPIRLKSVWVRAQGTAVRNIELRDGAGNLLQFLPTNIPNGDSRISLNLDLAPGSYQLGGTQLNLYRNNNSNVNYPFALPGLASINTSSNGNGAYYFFYDWEVAIVCVSPADSVVLELQPLPDPVLNKVSDTLSCGDGTQFISSGPDPVHWYDANNTKVFVGDTLDLPAVTQNANYRVRTEGESQPIKLGPVNPSALTGGGHFNFNQGLLFTVYTDMKLKSVLVDAGSAGNRDILLEDNNGNVLQTVTAFIPAGRSRVQLNLDIAPGNYRLMGDNVDLWRNTAGAAYPYTIPGVVDITGSTATQAGFYYFYYDWEVATICKSNFVQLDVRTEKPTPPVSMPDTLVAPCGNSAQFTAAAANDVFWYNQLGSEIARGDTLTVPFAAASAPYFAHQKSLSASLKIGVQDPDSLASGSYINSTDDEWLEFTAHTEIELQSVWVDANSAGTRTIKIRTDAGRTVRQLEVTVPAGKSRVYLNIMLPAGDYLIGGSDMDLYGNENSSPAYPFRLVGVVSITGSSLGNDTYPFFYDWEIAAVCSSDPDTSWLELGPADLPAVSPAQITLNCTDSALFMATGANILWYDMQGDLLVENDTLLVERVTANTSFFAQDIHVSPSFFGGPENGDAIGGGGMHNANFQSRLFFTVYADITLKSVWVHANTAGNRNIILEDGTGTPLDTLTINIPAGRRRVALDWELTPGNYRIGGSNMDLFRNDANVNYPYDVAGLISITTSSVGPDFYYYFYDWELQKTCISDTASVSVNFVPVLPPTVNKDTVSIICNGVDTVLGSGMDHLFWYNGQGEQVGSGDSLFIASLKDTATFFAINETAGKFLKGGPVDNTFGRGGYSQASTEWMVFDVFEDVILSSVKVYARTAGNRLFEYRDASGSILDSVTLFVPVGESRVPLQFQLQVGTDHQLAVNGTVDLFRNNNNVTYPYPIGSYVTLTKSNAILPFAFYHYFYDWEVGDPGCQSDAVPVFVDVTPIATPSVTQDDSICYNATATFNGSLGAGAWYDPNGSLVGYGSSYTTAPLTSGGTYSHIGETQETVQHVGPADASTVGPGGYHNASFDAFLYFTVDAPLRLNSVWVDADGAGLRTLVLQDGNGNTLQTIRKFATDGMQRMYLGLELQPGDYAIGGNGMDLYRNDNGASFPYSVSGLLSITGTSTGANFYYYFYDWEVQDIPCQSDTISFGLTVLPQIVPFFTFTQMDSTVNFNNVSVPLNASYLWDFGDGNTSTQEDPSYTYPDTGHFVVTLTVSNGNCEEVFSDSVYIAAPIIDGIDDLLASSFRLFPNPGNGRFTIEAQASSLQEMQAVVYDLKGRTLLQTPLRTGAHFREEVDLREHPAGTYMVQLLVDGEPLVRRYVLMK